MVFVDRPYVAIKKIKCYNKNNLLYTEYKILYTEYYLGGALYQPITRLKNCLGLDIGYDTLKVAQLTKKGDRILIQGLNSLPIPPGSITKSEIKNADKISSIIVQALDSAKPNHITAKSVISALPESLVFTKILTLPLMKPADLAKAIQYEAAEFLPNLNEVILDWQVLNETAPPHIDPENNLLPQTAGAKKPVDTTPMKNKTDPIVQTLKAEIQSVPASSAMQDILIVAAPKKLVEALQALVKKNRLNLAALETKPISASRALLKPNEKSGVLILDIGAEATSISVFDNNILHFGGTVASGGNSITRAIAQIFGLSPTEAEARKKTVGLDVNNKQEKQILLETLSPIIEEINRAIRYYHNRVQATDRITTIRLTGGTANLIAINPIIAEQTNCKVDTGNPLINISQPPVNYTPLIMRPYAVAIGCALRPFME